MNRHLPSLEQRIASVVSNDANTGSETLVELIGEAETAAQTAAENAEAERAKAIDLVQSPDAKTAHERVVEAELARDRLKVALPKLREKLAAVLEAERHDKWLVEYRKVEAVRKGLVGLRSGPIRWPC